MFLPAAVPTFIKKFQSFILTKIAYVYLSLYQNLSNFFSSYIETEQIEIIIIFIELWVVGAQVKSTIKINTLKLH
jgi:hypothetical protein